VLPHMGTPRKMPYSDVSDKRSAPHVRMRQFTFLVLLSGRRVDLPLSQECTGRFVHEKFTFQYY